MKMTSQSNGKDKTVDNFTKTWTIENISSILKVSGDSFHGIIGKSFSVFKNEARMSLEWTLSEPGSCILTPSVLLTVNYPISVMIRMIIKLSQSSYELKDGQPWTVVPGKDNVWKNQCKLDLKNSFADDSITLVLEMVHLICAEEIKKNKTQKETEREREKRKKDNHDIPIYKKEDRFLKMFKEGEKTDFIIIVDNKKINCHKGVLGTVSSIMDDFDENKYEAILILDEYQYKTIYEFVLFLYTMDPNVLSLKTYAEEFLALSDRFNVPLLKAAAESYLISQLRPSTAKSYAWLGLKHNAERMRQKAEKMHKFDDHRLFDDSR